MRRTFVEPFSFLRQLRERSFFKNRHETVIVQVTSIEGTVKQIGTVNVKFIIVQEYENEIF